jgi:hypothetical protein
MKKPVFILAAAAVILCALNVCPQGNAGSAQPAAAKDSAAIKNGPLLTIEDLTEDGALPDTAKKVFAPAASLKTATPKDTAPAMPSAAAQPVKDTLVAPLKAISVPSVVQAPQPFGCPTCTQPGIASSDFALNFLIGKNYLLPATKLFALASSNLWLVQKETRFGSWALAGGPSLETAGEIQGDFIYDYMRKWEKRVTDSLGITRIGYYEVYGGG